MEIKDYYNHVKEIHYYYQYDEMMRDLLLIIAERLTDIWEKMNENEKTEKNI